MHIRIKAALALLAAVLLGGAWTLAGANEPVAPLPSLAEPALSPDGSEIAFASGGDIWTVPSKGGQARLLVTDRATESRPLYSPDGSRLAFVSTRSGAANLYVLTLSTGKITRLTYADANEALDGWSRDGKWIYFTSGVNDVQRQGDIFRVSAAGGVPLEVSNERYLNEFQSAPSPDGKSIALMAKGISNGPVVASRQQPYRPDRAVAEADRGRRALPAAAPVRRPPRLADVAAGRRRALVHERRRRRRKPLEADARRQARAGDPLHRRPAAVADGRL
jgi:hypothetical protein